MRRAIFEWGAIFGLALSVLLFGYWLFSIRSRAADFELTWWIGDRGLQASASGGTLMLSNPGTTWETIEVIEIGMFITPTPTGRTYFAMSGLRMGYMTFPDGSIDWYLHFTLLIPAVLLMAAGMICGWMYWRLRARALAKAVKAADAPAPSVPRRAACMTRSQR